MIGRIASDPFIETVKNGRAKALFADVEFSHDETRTCQVFPGAGKEAWPCVGDIVAVEKVGGFFYISAVWGGEEPALKAGEVNIYSRNGKGKKQAVHYLRQDGKQFIGNDLTNLCEILLGIMDIIKDLQTAGAPGAHTVNPAFFPKIELHKKEIEKILTGEV